MSTPQVLMADGAIKRQGDNLVPQGLLGRAVVSAPYATAAGGWNKILFNQRQNDPMLAWDVANARLKPSIPGYYKIRACVGHNCNAAGNVYLCVSKNCTTANPITGGQGIDVDVRQTTNTIPATCGGEVTVYLNGTTDYAEVFMYWAPANWQIQSDPADGDLLTYVEWELTGTSVGLVPEPWRSVGGVGEPGFAAGWSNHAFPLRFYKDPHGLVRLSGRIQSTGAGGTIFTLPVGYRPNLTVPGAAAGFAMAYWNGSARVLGSFQVYDTGVVAAFNGADAAAAMTYVNTEVISFRADG